MFGFNLMTVAFVPVSMLVASVIFKIVNIGSVHRYGPRRECKRFFTTDQKGFTLIELMSVLIILGIMVSVAIKKFDLLSDTASINAIKTGIRELNTREALVWTNIKLAETDWSNDIEVYTAVDKNLGLGYSWNPGPTILNGTLHYKSQSVSLNRTASTRNSVGFWK